ncbi:hypothetical protein CPB97_003690 [Podila verticillata]|nr:hypothetical protein CPB97_003690 [Podila verticillata]
MQDNCEPGPQQHNSYTQSFQQHQQYHTGQHHPQEQEQRDTYSTPSFSCTSSSFPSLAPSVSASPLLTKSIYLSPVSSPTMVRSSAEPILGTTPLSSSVAPLSPPLPGTSSLTSSKCKDMSSSSLDPPVVKAVKHSETGKLKANTSKANALKANASKANALKAASSKATMSKAEDKHLFMDTEVKWLVERLADPEVYITLQSDRDSTVRDTPKERKYEELAKDMSKRFGYPFKKKQIKNKITKMRPSFNQALKQKNGSGFGSMDDTSWQTVITDICPYFFIMEEGWSVFWKDLKTHPINSLANSDKPFVVDAPPHSSHWSGEEHDTGGDWDGSKEGKQDKDEDEGEDEEEEEVLERCRPAHGTPSATPTATYTAGGPSGSKAAKKPTTPQKVTKQRLSTQIQNLVDLTKGDTEIAKAETELELQKVESQMQQWIMEHEREKMEHQRKLAFMANERLEHERKMALIEAEQKDQDRILKKKEMELNACESHLRILQLEAQLKEKGISIPGDTPSPPPHSPSHEER